ncbi:MAG TPA: NifU family protein [Pantanalinema sp.]
MPKIAEIEPTPNPNAIKFVLKEALTTGFGRSFDSADAASNDPLASQLFAIPHVTNVFYQDKWLTVTQDGKASWSELMRELAVPIRAAGSERSPGGTASASRQAIVADGDEARLSRINELLDTKVRPALAMDGGGLEVVELAGNILRVHYQGACGSCPSSISGTLMGIENLMQSIEPGLMLEAV